MKKRKKIAGIIPCFLFFYSLAITQVNGQINSSDGRDEIGNWIMYFGTARISERLSIHSEIQWRNHNITPNIEQLLLRGGLNYHIDNNFIITGGYGYISTHPYEKEIITKLSDEHRIFQQLIIRNSISRLFFEHRYRYEQRWITNDFSSDFRQRARYRFLVNIALNDRVIQPGSLYLSIYDEVFLNLHKGEVFDRNRLFAALGYQLSTATGIQVGYLRQTVPAFGKNYLQLALFYNPDFRE